MGIETGISWTHHTFSPFWGCSKVSPACDDCYAETLSNRFGFKIWGADAPRRFFGDKHWGQPLKWDRLAAVAGERRRVFCGSMCDWAEGRPDQKPHIDRLFKLIEATPNLDWLMLTKRPQLIDKLIPADWMDIPRHNVFWGTTAENQFWFDNRWSFLKKIPGVVHWISAEPMVGPIVLPDDFLSLGSHAWMITGGESHSNRFKARPIHPRWIKNLRNQCVAAGVPYHFKQYGEFAPTGPIDAKQKLVCAADGWSGDMTAEAMVQHAREAHGGQMESPPLQAMYCVGRKVAGRELDGKIWHEFPEA